MRRAHAARTPCGRAFDRPGCTGCLRRWPKMAGAFGRVRASEKYALGNERVRQLPARRPAGSCGVWVEPRPCSSSAAGPCRGLVLRERVRIRAVAGVRPGWSAKAGCRRSLVRPAWWRDGVSLLRAGGRLAVAAAARRWSPARLLCMSCRDPTGHGRLTAATGVRDLSGTPRLPPAWPRPQPSRFPWS